MLVEPGAALVSDLELSEVGEVVFEEAGAVLVSFLLDSCGAGLPEEVPVSGAGTAGGVFTVSALLEVGSGVAVILVCAGFVSVVGVWLWLLQPTRKRGRASANRNVTSKEEIFMTFKVQQACQCMGIVPNALLQSHILIAAM